MAHQTAAGDSDGAVLIVNPASAGGKTGEKWGKIHAEIQKEWGGSFRVLMTKAPQEATSIAHEVLKGGSKFIIAVGGDGTLSEVVHAFFDQGSNMFPEAILGYIPCGTGGDFRRSLGWEKRRDQALRRLFKYKDHLTNLDVGCISFTGGEERHFINVSSVGSSGAIAKIANDTPKYLGGLLTFYQASVRGLLQYAPVGVKFRCDDGEWQEIHKVNCFAVCNGKYFGGGMCVGPNASLSNGSLDITVWSGFGVLDFVLNSAAIYSGEHVKNPKTKTFRCTTVEVELPAGCECPIEIDGETPQGTPTRWSVKPGAIRFVA